MQIRFAECPPRASFSFSFPPALSREVRTRLRNFYPVYFTSFPLRPSFVPSCVAAICRDWVGNFIFPPAAPLFRDHEWLAGERRNIPFPPFCRLLFPPPKIGEGTWSVLFSLSFISSLIFRSAVYLWGPTVSLFIFSREGCIPRVFVGKSEGLRRRRVLVYCAYRYIGRHESFFAAD